MIDDSNILRKQPIYDWYNMYYQRALVNSSGSAPMNFDEWYKKIGVKLQNKSLDSSSSYDFVEVHFTDFLSEG